MRILTATATTTATTTNQPPRSPRYTATGVKGQRGKQSEYLLGVLLALLRAEGEPESLGYSSKVVLSMHSARQRCGRYLLEARQVRQMRAARRRNFRGRGACSLCQRPAPNGWKKHTSSPRSAQPSTTPQASEISKIKPPSQPPLKAPVRNKASTELVSHSRLAQSSVRSC